jgi:hypothetical protein
VSAPYRDGEVYAVTCTGCGGAELQVIPEDRRTETGDPCYVTTILCVACGAAIRSLLWRDEGRWYTTGQAEGSHVHPP